MRSLWASAGVGWREGPTPCRSDSVERASPIAPSHRDNNTTGRPGSIWSLAGLSATESFTDREETGNAGFH